jgi:hypothetical protein
MKPSWRAGSTTSFLIYSRACGFAMMEISGK